MAFTTRASMSVKGCPQALKQSPLTAKNYHLKPSVSFWRTNAPSIQSVPLRLHVSCAAKPETVQKISQIVKTQLALTEDTTVTGETKLAELGADSLDTVELVVTLEQEFGVTVDEDNALSITTIQGAADLIEQLQN